MKQRTAKSVVEALEWIHNNAHYEVGCEWSRTIPVGEQSRANMSHMYYANALEKLRVPAALLPEFAKLIRPNKRAFDTRMFALTRKGRSMLV